MRPAAAATDPVPAGWVGSVIALFRRRSLRYLIAGGINTAVGFAVFPLLLWSSPYLHRHYMLALVVAQAACLCFAFANYKIGVFRTRGNLLAEFAKFASFYLAIYAANWVVLPLLVEVAHIRPVVVQIGFNLAIVVGSFFWHSRVTFQQQE